MQKLLQKLLKKRRKPADAGAEEVDVLDGLMAEVLEQSKIPDAYMAAGDPEVPNDTS